MPEPSAAGDSAGSQSRGRQAAHPGQVPARGWKDIALRTKKEIAADNLSIVAAGVAFYGFLAFVPALTALLAVYAIAADPQQAADQISGLAGVLPEKIIPFLRDQVTQLAAANQAAGLSAIISFVLAVYGSTSATKALIQGLNIAYDEEEKRGFIKLQLVATVLTFGAIVGAVLAIGLVAVLPAVLEHLGLSRDVAQLVTWLRWPVLVLGFMSGLAVVYRYAPSRNDAQWKWVSPGAIVAACLWLVGSGLFSLYVAKVANYDRTYGSLGALVVFLLWLYLTAFVVLVGAEMNSELERQTERDTTEGGQKPLGSRQAYAADTVGPPQD